MADGCQNVCRAEKQNTKQPCSRHGGGAKCGWPAGPIGVVATTFFAGGGKNSWMKKATEEMFVNWCSSPGAAMDAMLGGKVGVIEGSPTLRRPVDCPAEAAACDGVAASAVGTGVMWDSGSRFQHLLWVGAEDEIKLFREASGEILRLAAAGNIEGRRRCPGQGVPLSRRWRWASDDATTSRREDDGSPWLAAERRYVVGIRCPRPGCSGLRSNVPLLLRLGCTRGRRGSMPKIFLFLHMKRTSPQSLSVQGSAASCNCWWRSGGMVELVARRRALRLLGLSCIDTSLDDAGNAGFPID